MENLNLVLREEEKAIFNLRSLYKKYGYMPYKMSKFEEYDLYVKNKDFLVSENIITFNDTDGKLMALKPDVTLSIIKNADNSDEIKKVYYNENVYRVSKGSNSYKEIMQAGLECLGNIDSYLLYETVMLASESLKSINPEYVLDISHLGIISSLLEEAEITLKQEKEVIKCISDKNIYGIMEILGKDNSVCRKIIKLIKAYGKISEVLPLLNEIKTDKNSAFIDELLLIVKLLNDNGYNNVNIDFSVVNDTNYYNGIVFKGFINGISSFVLSGGEYKNLMKKMGKKQGAVGFAVYLDLLTGTAKKDEYDVEAVILYDEKASVKALNDAVCEISKTSKSVTVQKEKPTNIKYKKLYRLNESGAELIEQNA